ncbi:MAG: hypothetical protein RIS47_2373 [Bacteroidota bacterium]
MKIRIVFALLGLWSACSPNADKAASPQDTLPYRIESDRVTQGNSVARAISAHEMHSDYQSPANDNFNPNIEFKFSINGQDNELTFGVNHHATVVAQNGVYSHPTIVWGKADAAETATVTNATGIPANTQLELKLDLRQILAALKKDGFCELANGHKLMKSDFKGVWLAGGTAPMTWDFDNLPSRSEMQLTDPDGDGIYTINLKINTFDAKKTTRAEWKQTHDLQKYPQYESGKILLDALYNLSLDELVSNLEADTTFRTGKEWAGVWTRDVSYSIVLALAAIEPEVAKHSLMRKVVNGRIVQDTGTGGSWPVSTDRLTWTLAAWEVYLATGDLKWLKTIYKIVAESAQDDSLHVFDPKTGLVYGESSFLDWRKQSYPIWMEARDIYKSQCLGTNVVHYRNYQILDEMAKILGEETTTWSQTATKLAAAINANLWIEEKSYYAQYLYGYNYFTRSGGAENLGESLAVLYGVATPERQRAVISHTPLSIFGVPTVAPQIPNIPPYHNNSIWPFVQAFYGLAAKKVGNEPAVVHSIEGIYRQAALFLTNKENMVATSGDFKGTEVNSDRQLWSIAGNLATVYRIFFGIDYTPDSLNFSPFVPKKYDSVKTLRNFTYRNATLDITVKGFGQGISSFTVDGKPQERASISGKLRGKHLIEIQLDNHEIPAQTINVTPISYRIESPVTSLNNEQIEWKKIDNAQSYKVFCNGQIRAEIKELFFPITNHIYGEWQVQAISSTGFNSYLSKPICYIPKNEKIVVEAESATRPSKLNYMGFTGNKFVESTIETNNAIPFSFRTTLQSEYLLDIRYSNGNGPTNTDNKCAIRTLYVDDERVGVIVLPQRGSGEWSNWGYSNALRLKLKPGPHKVLLVYEPTNRNMNGLVNTAMIDHLRIITSE